MQKWSSEPILKNEIHRHVLNPLLVKGMTVWITDDANKIPILVEAEALIGSVKSVINSISGIKHSITAKEE